MALAVVETLSLLVRLASLGLLDDNVLSSSLIRRFNASFSLLTASNSCRWNAVSSYLPVVGTLVVAWTCVSR